MKLYRWMKAAVVASIAIAVFGPAHAAVAADPYEINVILPLTGNIAFVGATQLQELCDGLERAGRAGNLEPMAELLTSAQNEMQRVLTALEPELSNPNL